MIRKSILPAIIFSGFAIVAFCQHTGSFQDTRDDRTYKTVQIGGQIWMEENLAFNTGQGCNYYDENTVCLKKFGYLYTWIAALSACPTGWHLPSDKEWTQLTDSLGGKDIAGGKLKKKGSSHWSKPNTGATNLSGFTALAGGRWDEYAQYNGIELFGGWWTSNGSGAGTAGIVIITTTSSGVNRGSDNIMYQYSVRCLKD